MKGKLILGRTFNRPLPGESPTKNKEETSESHTNTVAAAAPPLSSSPKRHSSTSTSSRRISTTAPSSSIASNRKFFNLVENDDDESKKQLEDDAHAVSQLLEEFEKRKLEMERKDKEAMLRLKEQQQQQQKTNSKPPVALGLMKRKSTTANGNNIPRPPSSSTTNAISPRPQTTPTIPTLQKQQQHYHQTNSNSIFRNNNNSALSSSGSVSALCRRLRGAMKTTDKIDDEKRETQEQQQQKPVAVTSPVDSLADVSTNTSSSFPDILSSPTSQNSQQKKQPHRPKKEFSQNHHSTTSAIFKVSHRVARARFLLVQHFAPFEALEEVETGELSAKNRAHNNTKNVDNEVPQFDLNELRFVGSRHDDDEDDFNSSIEHFLSSERRQLICIAAVCGLGTFDYKLSERCLSTLANEFSSSVSEEKISSSTNIMIMNMIEAFSRKQQMRFQTRDNDESNDRKSSNSVDWFIDQIVLVHSTISYFKSILDQVAEKHFSVNNTCASKSSFSCSNAAASASRALPYCTAGLEKIVSISANENKCFAISNNKKQPISSSTLPRPSSSSINTSQQHHQRRPSSSSTSQRITFSPSVFRQASSSLMTSPIVAAAGSRLGDCKDDTNTVFHQSLQGLKNVILSLANDASSQSNSDTISENESSSSSSSCLQLLAMNFIFLRCVCLSLMSKTILSMKTLSVLIKTFEEVVAKAKSSRSNNSSRMKMMINGKNTYLFQQFYNKTWYSLMFRDTCLNSEILGIQHVNKNTAFSHILQKMSLLYQRRENILTSDESSAAMKYLIEVKGVLSSSNRRSSSVGGDELSWFYLRNNFPPATHESSCWISAHQDHCCRNLLALLVCANAILEEGISFTNCKISSNKPWFDRIANGLSSLSSTTTSVISVQEEVRNLAARNLSSIREEVWKSCSSSSHYYLQQYYSHIIEIKLLEVMFMMQWCFRCVECAQSRRIQDTNYQQGDGELSSTSSLVKSRTSSQFLSAAACFAQSCKLIVEQELEPTLSKLSQQQHRAALEKQEDDVFYSSNDNNVSGGVKMKSLFGSSAENENRSKSDNATSDDYHHQKKFEEMIDKQKKEDEFLSSLLKKSRKPPRPNQPQQQQSSSSARVGNNISSSSKDSTVENVTCFPTLTKNTLRTRWQPLCSVLKSIGDDFVIWFCEIVVFASSQKTGATFEQVLNSPEFEYFDFTSKHSRNNVHSQNSNNMNNNSSTSSIIITSHEKQLRQRLHLPLAGEITKQQVSASFRRRAIDWHPDRHVAAASDEKAAALANEQFAKLNEAYQELLKMTPN